LRTVVAATGADAARSRRARSALHPMLDRMEFPFLGKFAG
jgi:hypothetical protein